MANPRLFIRDFLSELDDCTEHDLPTFYKVISTLEAIFSNYHWYVHMRLIAQPEVELIAEAIKKLHTLIPDNKKLALVEAKFYLAKGEIDKLIKMLSNFLNQHPLFWEGHYFLAELMYIKAMQYPYFHVNQQIFAHASVLKLDKIINYDQNLLAMLQPAAIMIQSAIHAKSMIESYLPRLPEKKQEPAKSQPPLTTSGFLKKYMPPDEMPESEEKERQGEQKEGWFKLSKNSSFLFGRVGICKQSDPVVDARYTKTHPIAPIGSERKL